MSKFNASKLIYLGYIFSCILLGGCNQPRQDTKDTDDTVKTSQKPLFTHQIKVTHASNLS